MTIKKTHTWLTQTGAKVTAECTLTLTEKVNLDGYEIDMDCCKKSFCVTVEGHGVVGYSINREPRTVNGIVYAANCGLLIISQENLTEIDEVVAEIESHPAWISKIERERKNRRQAEKLNAKRRENGLCPRCKTYCYGDCE